MREKTINRKRHKMILSLKLTDKHFKEVIVNMFKNLKENVVILLKR